MLATLCGDELPVVLSATLLLESFPDLRLILLLNHTDVPQQQPWVVTQVPITQHTSIQHITSTAALHRSQSSLMFLDSVERSHQRSQGRSGGTLLLKPTPLVTRSIVYQPQAFTQYLIQQLHFSHLRCLILKRGSVDYETLIKDKNSRSMANGPHLTIEIGSSTNHRHGPGRKSPLVSHGDLSEVHWVGMHHDLRLPRRVLLDQSMAHDDVVVNVNHKSSVVTLRSGVGGNSGLLNNAVRMSKSVNELVAHRLMNQSSWARL